MITLIGVFALGVAVFQVLQVIFNFETIHRLDILERQQRLDILERRRRLDTITDIITDILNEKNL